MILTKPLQYFATTDIKEIIEETGSSSTGLTANEAEVRLKELGKNRLAEKKEYNIIIEFLSHFKSPLIIILIIASIVSAFVGETADAVIIGVMILLSVVLDFFLEYGAERAAEKLKETVRTRTLVLRSNVKKDVSIENLCIGDVIFLSAGCLVPADAKIISSRDFFVNESSLTGESFPVEKIPDIMSPGNLSLTDMKNIIFMGTNVVSGSATAIVVKTGKYTEYGKISERLIAPAPESEFDRGIRNFGLLIMKATIFLVLFIFLFNSLVRHQILESFMFSVAIAVGLTPELLPMIMSVTMAQGSMKMAKGGVIVKRLSSIPNFGSMDVLCTDKTGTLTEDKIHLIKYTDVAGNDSDHVLLFAYLNSYFQTGMNNPLDEAVLNFRKINIKGFKKIDEIPFDFVRKKMSVVIEKSRKRILITKGAPEEIFKSSKYYLNNGVKRSFDKNSEEKIKSQYEKFSAEGYRVLAVAEKETGKGVYSKHDECNMTIIGFVSFLDPPKEGVKHVIHNLNKTGIEIKIITGDNELVTKKICDDISLEIKGILLGKEIETMTDDALRVRVEKTNIFARFSPDEKNRVIMALKANGHVVGYMGDGINDAPSIKTADIGISVSTAADVAKESAEIVLTRKNLAELNEGVLDGRKTFANTLKYMMMGVSSNFGNMFSVAVAIIFLPFLPMLPIQIILNNFIYDFSQITIPTDNIDNDYISKPKKWDMNFIKKFMIVFGPISSFFDILTFALLYLVFRLPPALFQTGWFIESLATQTLVIHFIRTKKIPFIQSRPSIQLLISSIACVTFGWILPFTPLGKLFGLQPLPGIILLSIALLVLVYFVIVELTKKIFYHYVDF